MTGGKGTRLRPYTEALPKGLVPLKDNKPILEIVVRQLEKSGFSHITMAVNYLADLIKDYFGDGGKFGLKIDYSFEEKPLHTIGPLTIIPNLPDNFLVINADTLTDLNYGNFLKEHIRRGNQVSVAAKKREVKIDFGVLRFDENNQLIEFQEKPTHFSHVAMGVNCLNRSVVERLPKGERYGFDDMMKDGLAKKEKIWVYEHDGFWIDIGRPEDYQYAVDNFDKLKVII